MIIMRPSARRSVQFASSCLKEKTIGITIDARIGLGDALQFCSLPENYSRAKGGKKLVDLSRPWFFDHNPYVDRGTSQVDEKIEMWNFPQQYEWPLPRKEYEPQIYLSNAEIWTSVLRVPVVMNRMRLYRFEDFPFEKRKMILFHIDGRSHGEMPEHIIQHVIKKYSPTDQLFLIGNPKKNYGLKVIKTNTLWDLAEVISQCRMYIGIDSGPSWIASCYPDVITKIVRTKPNPPELFEDWIPLEKKNIHSMWDSRERMTHNVSDRDIGFTWSYKRI